MTFLEFLQQPLVAAGLVSAVVALLGQLVIFSRGKQQDALIKSQSDLLRQAQIDLAIQNNSFTQSLKSFEIEAKRADFFAEKRSKGLESTVERNAQHLLEIQSRLEQVVYAKLVLLHSLTKRDLSGYEPFIKLMSRREETLLNYEKEDLNRRLWFNTGFLSHLIWTLISEDMVSEFKEVHTRMVIVTDFLNEDISSVYEAGEKIPSMDVFERIKMPIAYGAREGIEFSEKYILNEIAIIRSKLEEIKSKLVAQAFAEYKSQ